MTQQVRECSVARTLELVGTKWTLLAVRELMLGCHRFDEIRRNTGAPRDILTDRLRKLEDNGFVERVRYEDHPPRYEYRLTDLGRALMPVIATLREFGDRHLAGPDGPPLEIVHSCGQEFHPALACRACGDVARADDLTIIGTTPPSARAGA
ncbi:winged helix-turn-helix transcriptional regulator [Nocardioides sambongensis]|uniref:winged helix-turn-helix transcriptional regulator n=1 Tax=Nocardioides sambongensis TaxID=2589074 RepID=UPI0011284E39|nr:helix-turn-helix domain-containing protein [Nocardioides sambongensis]